MSGHRGPRREVTSDHRFTPPSPIAALRDEWLTVGLSAGPPDRANTEAAIAEFYRLIHRRPPPIVWSPSPAAACDLLGTDRLSTAVVDHLDSVPARAAQLIVGARRRPEHLLLLSDNQVQRSAAILAGRLRRTVKAPLRTTLIDGVAAAIRSTVPVTTGLITWYGPQEAHHLAYRATLDAAGLAGLSGRDRAVHEVQATLARTAGWWWPFDDVCVLSDRPITQCTEPMPHGSTGARRLHRDDARAVEFADGSGAFVLHGTVVPYWAVDDPTVARINSVSDAAVRRAAITRYGWRRFVDDAGLGLIDQAPDPAAPTCDLQLFSAPSRRRGADRILVTAHGWRTVPAHLRCALDAAAWTCGVDRRVYCSGTVRTHGELVVIPMADVASDVGRKRRTSQIPIGAEGLEVLGTAPGTHAHTVVSDGGSCTWTTSFTDSTKLGLGILDVDGAVVISHPEHAAITLTSGQYVLRRRRTGG